MQLYKSNLVSTKHFFSSREGGVSSPPYASLNLAYHVGDRRDDVMRNHKILAHIAGYDLKKLVFMNQIHSHKVHVVDEESFLVPSCDALVTNEAGVALMVMSADCAPVLLHDPVANVIAVAHVGRAGAFGDILSNVLGTMQQRFGSKMSDVCVAVGPRIGKCCYEVGEKEIEEAKQLGYAFACDEHMLNIDAIIKAQLAKNGLDEQNVEFLPYCTRCESERFFSYRAEKTTGRQAGVIVL